MSKRERWSKLIRVGTSVWSVRHDSTKFMSKGIYNIGRSTKGFRFKADKAFVQSIRDAVRTGYGKTVDVV